MDRCPCPIVGERRHDTDRWATFPDQRLQKLEAADARHLEIGENAVNPLRISGFQEFFRRSVGFAWYAHGIEKVVQRLQQELIVIDNSDRDM